MNDVPSKRDRIKAKIAASQERLKRDGAATGTMPAKIAPADAYPPETYRGLAGDYPWLAIAGGLAAGALIGSLLPRNAGGKVGKRILGLATVAAELGLAYSRQARDGVVEASKEGSARADAVAERISQSTAGLRDRARSGAGSAARTARSTGLVLAREAARLAVKIRK